MILLTGFLACDAVLFRTNFDEQEPALYYVAEEKTEEPTSADQLLILNYNIKYGGARLVFFWECEGERYNMTTDEVVTHMDAISEFITEHNPDIVILQEVDRQSLRSDYMDQTQYLLDNTHLNYGVYASQHQVDFLPTDGMGHVDFGNAILSRWPLAEATRIALPLVSAYPGYYRYLYLKRHILTTKIELPWNDNFYAVNTHLEAFTGGIAGGDSSEGDFDTENTKLLQIEKFHQVLSDFNEQGADWIAAGDLNSLPSGSERVKEFPDDCPGMFDPDDYTGEEEWLDVLFNDFNSGMSVEAYEQDNEAWFSYTGKPDMGWTRALDYMFTNLNWANSGADNYVLQDTEQGGFETIYLSDHAPVQAVLEVE
jgi:endonuclease/exonuclease/phosphatase family metal-dependent hydrolase